MVKSYRDLRVWQAAMNLVEQVYRLTRAFPKQETYGLSSQMQRAAVSIPSNIAEGHTREHLKEYLHHLSIAQASLAELETHRNRQKIGIRFTRTTNAKLRQHPVNRPATLRAEKFTHQNTH